ncbi:lantibiotic dehydratase [Streptomyces mirabilis]|uniref:lantibiotic dehydratase n=1 Tax=Streptomyces mirabilis TaxID=68239 RepID=UPI003809D4AF
MAQKSAFTATGPMLLRLAALRHQDFPPQSLPGASVGAVSDEDLVAYIRRLSRHGAFREAVTVSSSSLSNTVFQLESGATLSRKQLLRAALSLTRYMLRIAGRPTPFGLQAGVAPLRSQPRTRFTMHSTGRKSVRPDAGWFDAQAQRWLRMPEVRSTLKVVENDLCFERGERVVLPYGRPDANGKEVTVRNTEFVKWAIKKAKEPIQWDLLIDAAEIRFPGAPRDRLEASIMQLAQNDFLLTQLSPTHIDEYFLSTVRDVLADSPQEQRTLDEFMQCLTSFRDAPLGEGISHLGRSQVIASRSIPENSQGIQVDLRVDVDAAIPACVGKEVERYATTLWSMTPMTPFYAHMREYREAFTDKYGEHGAVHLMELIDPHTGLGFPRGYENPKVSTDARLAAYESTPDDFKDSRRLEYMAGLIQRGMLSTTREITLGAADVEALTVPRDTPPPPALELTFQLLSESAESLDAGRFSLVASPMIGSATAGASMGRFAGLVGIEDDLRDLVTATAPSGSIVAQIGFRPRNPRALNVTQVPGLLRHTIPIGQFHDPAAPGQLDWRHFLIAANGGRLRIVHEPTGKEVHPVVTHMLNLETQAPNLARFLAELRHTGDPQILQIWDWSGFGAAPWLPRVRLGRVVLSPLRWRPSPALRKAAQSQHGWDDAVQQWRTDLAVDDAVCVTQADLTYEIDLRDPFHRELLRRDVAKGQVKLTESIRALGAHGWSSGYANEIVVPLRSVASTTSTAVASPRSVLTPVEHHAPGGAWFYAQVMAIPQTHDDVACALDEMTRKMSDVVDKWHFLRFFSPEPHLRLRVRFTSDGAAPQMLQYLEELRQQRMIREVRLCAYEPETGRYGGTEATAATEDIFCLDSHTTTAQLRILRSGTTRLDRELLAVANYAMLLDSLGEGDWPRWVGKMFKKSTDGSVTRGALEEAMRIVQPGATAHNLEGALGLAGLAATWQESDAPKTAAALWGREAARTGDTGLGRRAALSVLHMHHNRLIGVDRSSELRTLTLLGHIARTHHDRLTRHRAAS